MSPALESATATCQMTPPSTGALHIHCDPCFDVSFQSYKPLQTLSLFYRQIARNQIKHNVLEEITPIQVQLVPVMPPNPAAGTMPMTFYAGSCTSSSTTLPTDSTWQLTSTEARDRFETDRQIVSNPQIFAQNWLALLTAIQSLPTYQQYLKGKLPSC